MKIRDINESVLQLTSTYLKEMDCSMYEGSKGYNLKLKDLPLKGRTQYVEARIQLNRLPDCSKYGLRKSLLVGVDPEYSRIGCRSFDKDVWEQIFKAAEKAQSKKIKKEKK